MTPVLAHYPRVVTACEVTACRQGKVCSFCTTRIQDCSNCRVCQECSGDGWRELPATVPCDCGLLAPEGGTVFNMDCPTCWGTGSRPAPWAKVEPGDEVLWDCGENPCSDPDQSHLCTVVVADPRDLPLVQVKWSDCGSVEPMMLDDLARIVSPGSGHEQARAMFGLDWKEDSS